MTQTLAYTISDLTYVVRQSRILNGINADVEEGEYKAIIGPNGAGKTTLLSCLIRVLTEWQGSIQLFHTSLEELSQKELAHKVSYVPQIQESTFAFHVREFLLMSRFPYLSPFTPASEEDHAAVDRALETTGMTTFADRCLGTLSSGERQKIFIAAALAQETPVLLLDEPVTFLDPRYQGQVNRLLRDLNQEHGRTIVTVSHDINGALMYADRILALKEGGVVFHGTPEEIIAENMLPQIFDTNFTFVEHPETKAPLVLPG